MEGKFSVIVSEMHESNGRVTFYVNIDRPDRPSDAMPWDDGRMSPFSSSKKDEAEIMAYRWDLFLNHDKCIFLPIAHPSETEVWDKILSGEFKRKA